MSESECVRVLQRLPPSDRTRGERSGRRKSLENKRRTRRPSARGSIPRTFGESPVRSTLVRPTSSVRSVVARVDRSWIESMREEDPCRVQRARPHPHPRHRMRRRSPAPSSIPRTFDTRCATRRGPTGVLGSNDSNSDRSARAPARPRDDSADIRRDCLAMSASVISTRNDRPLAARVDRSWIESMREDDPCRVQRA